MLLNVSYETEWAAQDVDELMSLEKKKKDENNEWKSYSQNVLKRSHLCSFEACTWSAT